MVTLRTVAATLALAAGMIGIAPAANAGHVVVGIGLPGIAIVAPAPYVVPVAPYAYYGPAYYGPAFVGGPVYGYYGRPYYRHGPRVYVRGYGGYRHY